MSYHAHFTEATAPTIPPLPIFHKGILVPDEQCNSNVATSAAHEYPTSNLGSCVGIIWLKNPVKNCHTLSPNTDKKSTVKTLNNVLSHAKVQEALKLKKIKEHHFRIYELTYLPAESGELWTIDNRDKIKKVSHAALSKSSMKEDFNHNIEDVKFIWVAWGKEPPTWVPECFNELVKPIIKNIFPPEQEYQKPIVFVTSLREDAFFVKAHVQFEPGKSAATFGSDGNGSLNEMILDDDNLKISHEDNHHPGCTKCQNNEALSFAIAYALSPFTLAGSSGDTTGWEQLTPEASDQDGLS